MAKLFGLLTILTILSCTEINRKAPIYELTDCPSELPENMHGRWALRRMTILHVGSGESKNVNPPHYIGRLFIGNEGAFNMILSQTARDRIVISGLSESANEKYILVRNNGIVIQTFVYKTLSNKLLNLEYYDQKTDLNRKMYWYSADLVEGVGM